MTIRTARSGHLFLLRQLSGYLSADDLFNDASTEQLKEKGTFGKDVEFHVDHIRSEAGYYGAIVSLPGKFDIDASGWKFLREDSEEDTKKLMKDFGLDLLKDEKTNCSRHTDTITFVDREGSVRKYMTGSIDETQSRQNRESRRCTS